MMANSSDYITGFYKKDENKSIWKWKGIENKKKNKRKSDDKPLSPIDFLQQNLQAATEGPGAGAGIGCGVGFGLGLVGGVGSTGGWPWSEVKMVFGVGMGCGLGVGFGYGQGLGVGSTWDSLKSSVLNPKNPYSKKKVVVQI